MNMSSGGLNERGVSTSPASNARADAADIRDVVRDHVNDALQTDPGNPLALAFIADVYDLVFDDPFSALSNAERALAINPGTGYAHGSLGGLELRRSRPNEALVASRLARNQLENTMAHPLQHRQAAQLIVLSSACTGKHRSIGPETDYALTTEPDHPVGARQRFRQGESYPRTSTGRLYKDRQFFSSNLARQITRTLDHRVTSSERSACLGQGPSPKTSFGPDLSKSDTAARPIYQHSASEGALRVGDRMPS